MHSRILDFFLFFVSALRKAKPLEGNAERGNLYIYIYVPAQFKHLHF